jgi:tetratricopeptide (TPR) repeat protein
LTDPALGKHARRFVWLSIDTEKDQNRAFLEHYPVDTWPTLMVIDADREQAMLRWAGAATVPQLERLFDDGERALRGDGTLARADRLAAAGQLAEAATAYKQALADVPETQRGRVVESLVTVLARQKETQSCAETARVWAGKLPLGSSLANVSSTGLGCALEAPKEAPWRKPAVDELTAAAERALTAPGLLADDRSGVYETLVDAHEQAGDHAGAVALAQKWLAFLEAEAAQAKTPAARAAFDAHRLDAAIAAGEPARALAPLQASERDLPDDYNAPARLAVALRELGRYDEALAALDRALAHAYGPRRIRLYETRASIYEKKGDRAGARRAIEDALKVADTLPPSQNGPAKAARLRKKLDSMPR